MNESRVIAAGALVGAVVGAAAGYLFFTETGKSIRDRMEPMVDEVKHEFGRFQKTIEKVGEMANEGLRVVNEFNTARSQSSFSGTRTSH